MHDKFQPSNFNGMGGGGGAGRTRDVTPFLAQTVIKFLTPLSLALLAQEG